MTSDCRSAICLMVVSLLLLSSPSQATGPPDQGTTMAGQGLDWQRTATELQALPPSIPPTLTPGQSFNANAASLVIGTCTAITDLVDRCSVTATLVQPPPPPPHEQSQLCNHWLTQNSTTIPMYVLKGTPDGTGAFRFDPHTRDRFLACSVTNPADPEAWEWKALGAVGKCMLWPRPTGPMGFPPRTGNTDEFNSCVRAVRADYCGNGVSYTVDGTQIDLYKIPPPPHTPVASFVLEAWWKPTGAVCVIHARWLALSPQCQGRFSRVLGQGESRSPPTTTFTGGEYHCDPSRQLPPITVCLAPPDLIRRAMTGAILADDSKLQ